MYLKFGSLFLCFLPITKAASIFGSLIAVCCYCAVETLHDQLRDCVDLMGIGLGGSRSDTVAEEGTTITKDQPKDIGDVRSGSGPYGWMHMRHHLSYSILQCSINFVQYLRV